MPTPVLILLIVAGLLLLFLCLLLLAVRPNRARQATAYYASFNYAHRGLHNDRVPENSLRAFEAACRAGYAIELDVQLSRDGVPMVFHDATLQRVCGLPGRLCDFTAEELGHMPLCGMRDTIPTLAAVLEAVRGRTPLLIEIKGERDVVPVCEATCALLDHYRGPYCMESFSPYAVHWFRQHRPLVVRGQLSDRLWRYKGKRTLPALAVQLLCTNFLTRPDFVAFNLEHRRSLPLFFFARLWRAHTFAWTVRTPEEQDLCLGYFDSIIFETIHPLRRNTSDETETGSDLPVRP